MPDVDLVAAIRLIVDNHLPLTVDARRRLEYLLDPEAAEQAEAAAAPPSAASQLSDKDLEAELAKRQAARPAAVPEPAPVPIPAAETAPAPIPAAETATVTQTAPAAQPAPL